PELRRRKTELDRAMEDYRRILYPEVPRGHYDRLGRLAETLGRWFEARGWWTLAGRDSAHAVEARAALTRLDRIQPVGQPATAGSTSMSFREESCPTSRRRLPRRRATGCSTTGATAPSRT